MLVALSQSPRSGWPFIEISPMPQLYLNMAIYGLYRMIYRVAVCEIAIRF